MCNVTYIVMTDCKEIIGMSEDMESAIGKAYWHIKCCCDDKAYLSIPKRLDKGGGFEIEGISKTDGNNLIKMYILPFVYGEEDK